MPQTRASAPIPGHRHGTISTYLNYRCGCAECREAWRIHKVEYQRRRAADAVPGPDGRPVLEGQHGTRSLYSLGCRCPECTQANTAYYRAYRTPKEQK